MSYFSGGKDSQCIYHLAKMAGVKFDAHYNVTTVDPPELMQFIKKNYPDVIWELPELTMWELIVKEGIPPMRNKRYCCRILKERGGNNRIVLTGVRACESPKRMGRTMVRHCNKEAKTEVKVIIDWTDVEVWEFLRTNKIKHCKLYDEGFDRLGCVGCPNSNRKHGFNRWPTIKQKYIQSFEKMINSRKERGKRCAWKTGQEVFDWWVGV